MIFLGMLNVTENAVNHLGQLLRETAGAQGKGLRVQITKGGCSGLQYEITLDSEKPGDAVTRHDEVAIFVDPESADYLRGATLDYNDGLTGTGFTINNPNATRSCGCGSSFEAARPA